MMTANGFPEFLRLLLGTVIYRPYVYGFFACFLFFALRLFKPRAVLAYLLISYLIAYVSEYSATRNGFPFGVYTYLDETRTRELWLSNVPFWDSLSFVFLSYFSWILAASLRGSQKALLETRTAFLAGFLMMLLDVVIDPLSLRGDRWFLGKIYYYPDGGAYFGVTLSNFAGWFFVGTATICVFQQFGQRFGQQFARRLDALQSWGCFGVYAGVFAFNLALTGWIREWDLFAASAVVVAVTLGLSLRVLLRESI
jgi:uncharacterized membrane protein